MRKFVTPACQNAWDSRLAFPIPWAKIWRIKSFFATPRDQMVWLKLQHRNLYVAGHDPADNTCRACTERESQLHLCECTVIHMEFWSHIIKMAVATGMPAPQDTSAFLATGALSWYTVISNFHSGIFFIGWRCLYAASVKSRIDNKPLDLEAALKRTVAMIIGRLKAYGGKWKRWIAKTRHQRKPGVRPPAEIFDPTRRNDE